MNNFKIITLSMLLVSSVPALSNNIDTATDSVNTFEKLFGVTEGKRRNHTKGFCFSGTLLPKDKAIQQYSNSSLFTDNLSVIGRLSHKGGKNLAPDNKPGEYGMALSITTTDNQIHLMSMNTLDFFPVSTPEAFTELMHAKIAGKPAVKAFKQRNKDLQRFKAHYGKKSKQLKPYEGQKFNSVNSFYLVNNKGEKTAVRWSFVPQQEQKIVVEPAQNFFFDNLQTKLDNGPVKWDMVVTFAAPEDDVNNAAIAWSDNNKKITAAELVVNKIQTENTGGCNDINYDPLALSMGFEASADPLLQARRNSYAVAFGRRITEK